MSVLIKGMKMPSGCIIKETGSACPLLLSCGVWQSYEAPPLYRPYNCPLVEVSALHGRLIDAEKLHTSPAHCFVSNYPYEGEVDCGWRDVVYGNDIEAIPTVIEAEG